MIEINRINHAGSRSRDLDVAQFFYESLGFNFIVGPVGPETSKPRPEKNMSSMSAPWLVE